jgi:hypothetical protein
MKYGRGMQDERRLWKGQTSVALICMVFTGPLQASQRSKVLGHGQRMFFQGVAM